MEQQTMSTEYPNPDIGTLIDYRDGFFYVKNLETAVASSFLNGGALGHKKFYTLSGALDFISLVQFVDVNEEPLLIVKFKDALQAFYTGLNNYFIGWSTAHYHNKAQVLISHTKSDEYIIVSYKFRTLANPNVDLIACDVRIPIESSSILNMN
jgi:hypothetical protein